MFKFWFGLLVALTAVSVFYFTRRPPIKVTEQLYDHYDYIIVGAGSAGSVIASRLSEDPDVSVLLLEAGPAEHVDSEVPGKGFMMPLTPVNWNFRSEPEKYCCGDFNNNTILWHSGKTLGGSSSINFMIYTRGSRHDFDAWEAQGCEGWGYDDVLPYFIKSEGMQDPELAKSGYHGACGPLKVSSNRGPASELVIQASKELGYSEVDSNGENQIGFSVAQRTVGNGRRSSTAEAFLRPAMYRNNLHIATEAHVTKIMIAKKKTEGVEFIRNGKKQIVKSDREVIVSAGAVMSPQLLMLSGIGPREHLQSHKIDAIADLPVGQNLNNHYWVREPAYILDKPITFTEKEALSLKTQMEYKLFGSGLLASNGLATTAFLHTQNQPKEHKYPYLLVLSLATSFGSGPASTAINKAVFNYKDEVFESLHGGQEDKYILSFCSVLLHPFSRGSITLRSTDPLDHPVIDANAMADPRDAEVLAEGMKVSKRLVSTNAFESVGAKLVDRPHPSCKHLEPESDEYYECFARMNAYTMFHPSTTCKMGPEQDPEAVVDVRLRVKGVSGLRVADASIMPFVTSSPTNANVIMIGEKAADLIKQDRKVKR